MAIEYKVEQLPTMDDGQLTAWFNTQGFHGWRIVSIFPYHAASTSGYIHNKVLFERNPS